MRDARGRKGSKIYKARKAKSVDTVAEVLKEFEGKIIWEITEWSGRGTIVKNGYLQNTSYIRSERTRLLDIIEKNIKDNFNLDELLELNNKVDLRLEETINRRQEQLRKAM